MMDILDKLQSEDGYVRIVMSSGAIMFGKPDCIVYDEDENGDEIIKKIRFETWGEPYADYFGIDDIAEYDQIDEEDIPPAE